MLPRAASLSVHDYALPERVYVTQGCYAGLLGARGVRDGLAAAALAALGMERLQRKPANLRGGAHFGRSGLAGVHGPAAELGVMLKAACIRF